VPPLGFAAAARAGIPSAAMTNFGWDWIYAAWGSGFHRPIARIRAAYRAAEVLFRLPLHPTEPEAFAAFRRVEDVPLVARLPRESRAETRRRLGLPPDATVVLLSFGGFDAARLDLRALGAWSRYLFVLTPAAQSSPSQPDNVRALPRRQLDYAALVQACDVVVTKPGYGIVADCLVGRVRVLYTDRGPFREYPVLAAALERLGPSRYVPSELVRRGQLGPELDALLALRRPWAPLRLDGAAVVADALARMLHGSAMAPVPAGPRRWGAPVGRPAAR
jgi:UDP:flavonoid glycosyltransferase YjiC (YdhE family)